MNWDWAYVAQIIPSLASGVWVTIRATFWSSMLAMGLGLLLAIVGRGKSRYCARAAHAWAAFIRRTPLLVQLYFLFYVLPDVGIVFPPMVAGILGLGFHYATYTSEIYRAGIDNVPAGQWEAAKALNLTRSQLWRRIVLPQAVPPMLPALSNYVIAMFKETPLLSTITVMDLMGQARSAANFSFRYLEPMTLVGLFFLVMSASTALLLRRLESWLPNRRYQ